MAVTWKKGFFKVEGCAIFNMPTLSSTCDNCMIYGDH